MQNFKIRLISLENPYPENSSNWQKLVDIHCTINSMNEVSLLELCSYHDLSPKFYKDLTQLINDNLITIEVLK